MRKSGAHPEAFTLVELLVVIGIIGLLVAILLPALSNAQRSARLVKCSSNLHQVGLAIQLYANEYKGSIPFGPKAAPMSPLDFYTVTGDVTSLISLNPTPPAVLAPKVGLGLLLDLGLKSTPQALFCPDPDQPSTADDELAKVGKQQAQSDYYYRHGSVALMPPEPAMETLTTHIRLGNLGTNSTGEKIRALAMDVNFLADPSLAPWGVVSRTNHRRKKTNILYSDGHVVALPNDKALYTVNVGANPYVALTMILSVFETADKP